MVVVVVVVVGVTCFSAVEGDTHLALITSTLNGHLAVWSDGLLKIYFDPQLLGWS